MGSLREMVKELERAQQEEPTPSLRKPIPGALIALAREIGDDSILAEAALNWVRTRKREANSRAIMAKLSTLYTEDELKSMKDKAIQDSERRRQSDSCQFPIGRVS